MTLYIVTVIGLRRCRGHNDVQHVMANGEWFVIGGAEHFAARPLAQVALSTTCLEIYEERKPGKGVPYARLIASDLAWLGEVSLGMPKDKVAEVLKRKRLQVNQTEQGCEVRAAGFHALENNVQFRTWKVRCNFKNGLLSRLAIEADDL